MICLDMVEIDGDKYVKCKDVISILDVTADMGKRYIKNATDDPILSECLITTKGNTSGGRQMCKFIKYSHILMWICKINTKSLSSEQLERYMKLYSSLTSNNVSFNILESDEYYFESKLRDEIYNVGSFNQIKIYEKEKRFDFGRIDLYGVDELGKRCCIELKKGNAFDNTKEQLMKYKNSNKFDRVIYCAKYISGEFKDFLYSQGIEAYTYSRDLRIVTV